jgi:hypothetical protein
MGKIIKFVGIFLLSMVQYKLALISVLAVKEWHIVLQFICVSSGYMTMTVLVCFFEKQVRHILQWVRSKFTKKPVSFKKRRKMVKFAHKYGVWGVALLSPVTLGALAGSVIAVSLGGHKKEVIFTFLIGCLIWTVLVLGLSDVIHSLL